MIISLDKITKKAHIGITGRGNKPSTTNSGDKTMTINHENCNITLTQDAYSSSDTRFIDSSDYPHGAYEASGFDATTGESCTVVWEALTEDDSEDNADWDTPTTVFWHSSVSEYFEELNETA